MRTPDYRTIIKKLVESIPKSNIEKFIFKGLVSTLIATTVIVIFLAFIITARDEIESKMKEAGRAKKAAMMKKTKAEEYASIFNLIKYPEGIDGYTRKITRDPFSEYRYTTEIVKTVDVQGEPGTRYDLVLRSIEQIVLPMVYKGYIELPDSIIGQINWRGETRFIKVGSLLNGYQIHGILKEKVEAVNSKGKKIEFVLNKPVFGGEFKAVLYDKISQQTFLVEPSSEIGPYKVIDIASDHITLLSGGKRIELEPEGPKPPRPIERRWRYDEL